MRPQLYNLWNSAQSCTILSRPSIPNRFCLNLYAQQRSNATAASEAPKTITRFWKNVHVKETQGKGVNTEGFNILLDGRTLKSPTGTIVRVPWENKVLALLVAAEWEGQDKILKSYTLPMVKPAKIDFYCGASHGFP